MATEVLESITAVERAKLENHETAIECGRRAVFATGRALAAIREERLYRADYPTFEAYCQERWKFTRARASQLIGFHAFLLEHYPDLSTVVDTDDPIPQGLPDNERFVRELKRLPGNQQKECWVQIMQLADDGQPTLALVKATVDKWLSDALQDDDEPSGSERTRFDDLDDADEEPDQEESNRPLRPASERSPEEEADRIAESTVHTIERDFRCCPIAGRVRWYEAVAKSLNTIATEAKVEELYREDAEAAIELIRPWIDGLTLGALSQKATWVEILAKTLLDRSQGAFEARSPDGMKVTACRNGLMVQVENRRGVVAWDEIHEAFV